MWVDYLITTAPDVRRGGRLVHFFGIFYPPKVPLGLSKTIQAIATICFANKIPNPIKEIKYKDPVPVNLRPAAEATPFPYTRSMSFPFFYN